MPLCTPFIDSSVGRITTVTSTTRPTGTGLYFGRIIVESDTNRTLQYDGTGWVILSEPLQSFTPTVTTGAGTITTLGTASFLYTRSNGFLNYRIAIPITTNGTGAGSIRLTVPVAYHVNVRYSGSGREELVSGKTLAVSIIAGGVLQIINYDNTYPGGDGYLLSCVGSYQMLTRYS